MHFTVKIAKLGLK